MARSAFTDGFLLMLLNHEDAFLSSDRALIGLQGGTKLLLTAVLPYPVYRINSCMSHIEGRVLLRA